VQRRDQTRLMIGAPAPAEVLMASWQVPCLARSRAFGQVVWVQKPRAHLRAVQAQAVQTQAVEQRHLHWEV